MFPTGLKSRLAAGSPVRCFWLSLASPSVAELAADAGADCLVLDEQHGLWSRDTIEHCIGVVSPDTPVLVRTRDASDAAIGAALDAGACGVLVPMIEDAETAAGIAAAAQFPPTGRRSRGGLRPMRDPQKYMEWAADNIIVAAMIETKTGLNHVEQIAAVKDLDMIFVGTGDLSVSLAGDPHAYEKALETILKACDASGIAAGLYSRGPEDTQKRFAQGFKFGVAADDVKVLRAGFSEAVKPQKA